MRWRLGVTVRREIAAIAAAGALLAVPVPAVADHGERVAHRFDSALPRAAVAARQTWLRGARMGEQARALAAERAAAQAGAPPRDARALVGGAAATVALGDDLLGEADAELARRAAADLRSAAPFEQRDGCAAAARGLVSWLRTLPAGDALAAVAERAVAARC